MSMLATIAKPAYDNSIKAAPAGSAFAYSASTGVLDANFGATIGTADAIQLLTQGGYTFGWRPDTVNVIDTAGNITEIDAVNPNAAAQVWQNKISYVGTTAATSDEFTVDGQRLKHDVRMVAPPSLPSGYTATPQYLAIGGDIGTTSADWADVELWADGAVQTVTFTTTGALSFRLISTGKEIYNMPAVTITDDAGNVQAGGYLVEFGVNNTVTLYTLAPWDWMQQAQYPVVIDPTVVVNSAYDTSGNGGRKIIRLSNGWIVAGAFNSSNSAVYLFVSKDNGQTWTNFFSPNGQSGNWAIASSGTVVYVLSVSGTSIYISSYDLNSSSVLLDMKQIESQSSFGSGVSLAVDGTGALHAAWCSKNSTYPNSFNIRYGKSTDGGSTWTVTQLTTDNTSGSPGYTNPSIAVTSANTPIVAVLNGNSAIEIFYGPSFTQATISTGISIYAPNIAIDGNGNVVVIATGYDAASSAYRVLSARSTDGGASWSAPISINAEVPHNNTGTITADPSNNLHVFYAAVFPVSASFYNIGMVKYDATTGTWGAPVAITSNTTNTAYNPSVLWSEFNMNSSDAVRMIYTDAQAGAVEYYTIPLDNPPNAPILNTEANFDATTAAAFSWQFSDPDPGDSQSAYQLQIVDVASGTTAVDTGKVASTASTYTLAANTLTNGKQYQWCVTTWDSSGEQGPYSAYATFNTAAAPTVTITSPANGATDASSSETVQFSYSDPASNAQASYQVQLLDSTDATVLADSGVINGTNNQWTVQYTLANNTTYHVRARATNSQGITSAWSNMSFSTSFTQPAQGELTVTPDSASAKMTLAITNPAPTGGEPTVSSNDLYRKQSWQTSWTRIATGVAANASYDDYEVASGVQYDYKVTSYGNNGTQIDSATVSGVSVTFTGTWLHDVSNPAGTILNLPYFWNQTDMGGQTPNGEQWTPTATQMQFAGRTDPIVEFGEAETFQVTKGALTMELSDGNWAQLSQMLRTQTTLCLRDGRGRRVFGNVLGYQEVDLVFGNQVQTLTFTQTAYSVAV